MTSMKEYESVAEEVGKYLCTSNKADKEDMRKRTQMAIGQKLEIERMTHATHKPTHPRYPRHPRTHATDVTHAI